MRDRSRRFEGKTVLITGAARGQGRAHAVRFAEEGANVNGTDTCEQIEVCPCPMGTAEDLAETVRLVEDLDQRMVAVKADVRDGAAMKEVVDRGLEEFGGIDVVVANAEIYGNMRPTHELSEESFRNVVDVCLVGFWNSVRHVVPSMIERGEGGALIMISSAAGMKAYPGVGDYVAAKHGVVGLMRVMAVELGPHMIRVNSVHPTNVDTPLFQFDELRALFVPGNPNPTDEEYREAATGMNLLPVPWLEPGDMSADPPHRHARAHEHHPDRADVVRPRRRRPAAVRRPGGPRGGRRPGLRQPQRAHPQRARTRQRAGSARALRRDRRVRQRVRDPRSQERQSLVRRVPRGHRGACAARPAGRLEVEAVIATAFGCPYEGRVEADRVFAIVRRLIDAGAREIGFGDTTGMACT